MKPLTAKQRSTLARIAKEAWALLTKRGAIDEPFDDWRKRIAKAAVNGRTISTACNDDFDALLIAFKVQSGQADAALQIAMHRHTNTQRNLWHRIAGNLERADLPDSYALKIATDAHYVAAGATVDDLRSLPVRDLTNLSHTIARAVGRLLKARAA